ncbi:alpha/beta hydrolase [Psychromarinibacter sp. C21-152]|uniref:Alpha/beta hydrolase n=1 Tax=Psychromarinibacter sediminicola TaxID=3033385 RepID=A0AAE3NW11_9RHOB|nr:alpha/beta hydrolase [Psychromarinibacter sediminicola]MDF0603162.1 alpha/beta hydrolase [Psychromarinibacter sediminicola]
MNEPSETMRQVLTRLEQEDAGLVDPTRLAPQHGRALADLTNMRWNVPLPEMAEARTVMHAGLPARLVTPPNDSGRDAILHVHGGGWAFCSPATHEGAARRLALACCAPVLTVDYRLAPEHPWPAGLEDVTEAFRAADGPRRWSIAGDSAGANLALCATLRLVRAGERVPAQALLFYGVYAAEFDSPSYVAHADGPGLTRDKMRRYWDMYVPAPQRTDPEVAPLTATDADLAALPPLYLNAAGLDPLRSETERLFDRLRGLGRHDTCDVIPGVIHGFMQMGQVLPEASDAFARAGAVFTDRADGTEWTINKEEERP